VFSVFVGLVSSVLNVFLVVLMSIVFLLSWGMMICICLCGVLSVIVVSVLSVFLCIVGYSVWKILFSMIILGLSMFMILFSFMLRYCLMLCRVDGGCIIWLSCLIIGFSLVFLRCSVWVIVGE